MPRSALFTVPCDILIPAARPDCIHIDNARQIQAKIILQGANIPATIEADAFEQISEKIRRNTLDVLDRSRHENIERRHAAIELARERITTAMQFRSKC